MVLLQVLSPDNNISMVLFFWHHWYVGINDRIDRIYQFSSAQGNPLPATVAANGAGSAKKRF